MGQEKPIQGVVQLGNVTGAVTIDASRGNYFNGALTGNATLTVANVRPGHEIAVALTQNNSGGFTVLWTGAGGQTINGSSAVNPAANTETWLVLKGSAIDMTTADVVSNTYQSSVVGGLIATDSVVKNVPSLSAFDVTRTESGVSSVQNDILLLGANGVGNGLFVVGPVAGGLAPLTRASQMPLGSGVPGGLIVRVQRTSGNISNEWMALCSTLTGGAVRTAVVGTTDPQFYPRACWTSFSISSGTQKWGVGGGGVGNLFYGATFFPIDCAIVDASGAAATVRLNCPSGSRVSGVAASVVIQAEVAAGTVNAADGSFVYAKATNW